MTSSKPTQPSTPRAVSDERVRGLLDSVPTGILIDGQFREAASGTRFDVLNPATGEVLTTAADADEADARAAMDAVCAAAAGWRATPPRERAEVLRRAFELVTTTYREDLALLMTLEMGKPLAQSDGEVTYGGEFLRWFSEEAVRIRGDWFRVPEGHLQAMVVRRPVGPCLFVTPWNFPLAMGTRKLAPALAAGCTAILRPSQVTPLTSLLLGRILTEAGVPDGVIAVVPSSSARAVTGPLLADDRLRKLSFTGSTAVGRALLKEAADGVLRTSMELGGNAPFIVFDDADLDAAVDAALATKMRNMGEACNAADHFLVQEGVREEFARRLAEAMAAQRIGNGLEDGVDVGPLVSAQQRDAVAEAVKGAVDAGATVLTGGERPGGPGFFYPPTVLTDLPADADIIRNEIFGPVAPIIGFSDEAEAVALANDDAMGLQGYVHTRDMERVLRLTEALEVGMLSVNTATTSNVSAPFGGVKQSGLGREGGKEGIEEYLETVYVGLTAPELG